MIVEMEWCLIPFHSLSPSVKPLQRAWLRVSELSIPQCLSLHLTAGDSPCALSCTLMLRLSASLVDSQRLTLSQEDTPSGFPLSRMGNPATKERIAGLRRCPALRLSAGPTTVAYGDPWRYLLKGATRQGTKRSLFQKSSDRRGFHQPTRLTKTSPLLRQGPRASLLP
jgi:hypothetical protein